MSKPRRVPQISLKTKPGSLPYHHNMLQLFKAYLRILVDLKFTSYLTVQLLPLLYVVLVLGGLGVITQYVWDAFALNIGRGLAYLLASPLALLVWASACRATTEFLLVVFRMSEDVHTLAGIRPTVDKLDSMVSGPNWFSKLAPFIKAYQSTRESTDSSSRK